MLDYVTALPLLYFCAEGKFRVGTAGLPAGEPFVRAIRPPGAVNTHLVGHHGLAGEVHEAPGRAQQRGPILMTAGHRV